MSFYHHGTIRKYTSALLDMFNDLEIQYKNSNGVLISKNIPIKYSSREKATVLDSYTSEQITSGNTNALPRASLTFDSLSKLDDRVTNKNIKMATFKNDNTLEFMYNSVPYLFNYSLVVQCRGMNEATMIIEQVAPKFNPTKNIDIWDATNLDEPTRIPLKLAGIDFENEEYEDLSTNIVTVTFNLELVGNLYPPVKSVERITELKMYINEQQDGTFTRKSIFGWDVNLAGEVENEELTQIADYSDQHAPMIIDIVSTGIVGEGTNDISVIYDDKDNKLSELTFEWSVISGSAVIDGDLDRAVLDVSGTGSIEVQVIITDAFGNYTSSNKVFTV